MFGVVPRPLWSAKVVPDERNRIALAMRPLVVRGVRTMLIDAGLGDKEDARFQEIYGVERGRHLDHSLAEAGIAPEDIDIVLATHLHFDHAGGFTVRDATGTLRPRFPRARYVVRRGEWEDATHPHERNRASYLADNFVPLLDAGVLELVDDDQTIMPGVRVRRTGGHTAHHQMAIIESGGRQAAYVGGPDPDDGARASGVDHGVRSLPDGHARGEEGVRPGSPTNGRLVFFATRSGCGCRLSHPGRREAPVRAGARLTTHRLSDRHHDVHIGIIGGSGLYDMAELTDREERTIRDAVRRPFGPVRRRDAARDARGVSRAARRRATGSCRPS